MCANAATTEARITTGRHGDDTASNAKVTAGFLGDTDAIEDAVWWDGVACRGAECSYDGVDEVMTASFVPLSSCSSARPMWFRSVRSGAGPHVRGDAAAGYGDTSNVTRDWVEVVRSGYDAMAQRHLTWISQIKGDPRLRFLRELNAKLPDDSTVLDLGCGQGVPSTNGRDGLRTDDRRGGSG
jgi:hypothetical protein